MLLLAIREKRSGPQVISTDRHISQGGVELEDVTWDDASQTLHGISAGPTGTDHNVFVYLPQGRPWTQTTPFLFHDFPGYTIKMMDDHVLRVRLHFADNNRVAWSVNLKTIFGG